MSFIGKLNETLNDEFNLSYTENGALGYRTSGKELLDLNFSISSLRSVSDYQVERAFTKAFYADKKIAIKYLFYAGDVRFGLGERRFFRIGIKFLAENEPELALKVLSFVPEYTRWDNYLCLLETSLRSQVCEIIAKQLFKDLGNKMRNENVSLLAKWLPSVNASSATTKKYAKIILEELHLSESKYRKILSSLRSYLKVVEVKMSNKQWSEIDYSAVPSRANLIYNNAFLRNDEERRREYLASLEKGETKINAGVLFPHDIVHRYKEENSWSERLKNKDATLEELWKALPNYVEGGETTICVADGSGSMCSKAGNGTSVTCLDVANALTIYFSERCSGEFKDKYITFSEHPQLVDLSKGKTLRDKIAIALQHSEIANTNIKAVFDLILTTAIKFHMTQNDLPKNILILSDMEFDYAADGSTDKRLFETISQKYSEHGYKLPRLVFWNICSRTGTIPVKENPAGVALVSGFSPSITKMVLSNSTDPYECLLEQLNSERYMPIEHVLQS